MDIDLQLSQLAGQLNLLVDLTEDANSQLTTSSRALASTFQNLLQQVENISQQYQKETRKRNSAPS
ncbi:hypothetical protein [Acinetobacter venetianus]|uniref:hypothetical protein n=1 Tax=Acinetobacter venetianus TaxID=52133 RepID=UPI00215052AF|nr:hypothetical protein [Acinetobacter venetianus]